MMKTNFHTHTFRCGHAVGNEEAMVKSAIEEGIEVLGFSEHVPLPRYRKHIFKGMRILLIIFVRLRLLVKQSLLMVLQCECHIKISSYILKK